MIRFNSKKEREIKFDSALEEVVDIEVIKHLRYHEVIKEFMVTAHEASAKYAHDNGIDNADYKSQTNSLIPIKLKRTKNER